MDIVIIGMMDINLVNINTVDNGLGGHGHGGHGHGGHGHGGHGHSGHGHGGHGHGGYGHGGHGKNEYSCLKKYRYRYGEPRKIQFHVYWIKVVILRTCLEPLVLIKWSPPESSYCQSVSKCFQKKVRVS